LLFAIRPLLGRIGVGVLLAGALLAVYVLNPGRAGWPIGVALLIASMLAAGRFLSPRGAAIAAALSCAAITAAFITAGAHAARQVEQLARVSFPGESPVDRILEPSPTNPFCWNVVLLQRDATNYLARHGVLAFGPLSGPQACPRVFQRERGTAPWEGAESSADPRMRWLGKIVLPLDRLPQLVAGDCQAQALMQFVRAPFAVRHEGRWLIGDLRFDREPGAGFAEIELDASTAQQCPRAAPWIAPRAELLGLHPGAGATMEHAGEQQ
jgi:inner membrane protein